MGVSKQSGKHKGDAKDILIDILHLKIWLIKWRTPKIKA